MDVTLLKKKEEWVVPIVGKNRYLPKAYVS